MADLNGAVRLLNITAGFTAEEADAPTWSYDEGKGIESGRSMVGRYILHGAYGGWQLAQIINEGGGIRTITGYGTKREAYHLIQAYREGMGEGKGDAHYTLAAIRSRMPEYRAERAAYAASIAALREVAR